MAILWVAFYITKPFLPALLTGAIIAYLSHPLFKKILARVGSRSFASLLVSIMVMLFLTVPFILVIGVISKEAIQAYSKLEQQKIGTNFLNVACRSTESMSCRIARTFASLLPGKNIDYYVQVIIEKVVGFVIKNASMLFASIPETALILFVTIFTVYYLLKDGEAIWGNIKRMIPLKDSHKEKILKSFTDTTFAVVYANIAVAIVQGILGAIGFIIFGVESPILWGAIMIFFAFIPYFGTVLIWLPAALDLIFKGYLQNSSSAILRGTGLILYGTLIIGTIDNFLKPKLIGSKAKVHPIAVLLGVLGGLRAFGFLGLILGPVILALLMTFIDIYDKESSLKKYFNKK